MSHRADGARRVIRPGDNIRIADCRGRHRSGLGRQIVEGDFSGGTGGRQSLGFDVLVERRNFLRSQNFSLP